MAAGGGADEIEYTLEVVDRAGGTVREHQSEKDHEQQEHDGAGPHVHHDPVELVVEQGPDRLLHGTQVHEKLVVFPEPSIHHPAQPRDE